MPNGRRLLGLATGVIAVLAFVVFGLSSSSPSRKRVAPALPAASLSGPQITLSALRGKPALVVFWASWCEPCHQEAPALERFYRSPAGRGRVVGVDWNDPQIDEARSFIRHYGWTFPVLRDAEGTVGIDYRLKNVPSTFVLDSDSRIRSVLLGPQTQATLTRALADASHS